MTWTLHAAGSRIVDQFDQVAATELFVLSRRLASRASSIRAASRGTRRLALRRLNGVAAGTMSEIDIEDALVGSVACERP